MKHGEALTWDELATIYDETTGGKARIRPINDIFSWAEKQKNKFYLDPEEGTLHLISKD